MAATKMATKVLCRKEKLPFFLVNLRFPLCSETCWHSLRTEKLQTLLRSEGGGGEPLPQWRPLVRIMRFVFYVFPNIYRYLVDEAEAVFLVLFL